MVKVDGSITFFKKIALSAGLGLVIIFADEAQAQSCSEVLPNEILSVREIFDPASIQITAERKGISFSLEKLRFSLTFFSGAREMLEGARATLVTLYEDTPILFQSFSRPNLKHKTLATNTGHLQDFSGIGLGSLAYIVAAKLVFNETGLVIRSDSGVSVHEGYRSVSDPALAVWDRFGRMGYVSKKSGAAREFRAEVLAQDQPFAKVMSFLEGRLEVHHPGQIPKPQSHPLFEDLKRHPRSTELLEAFERRFQFLYLMNPKTVYPQFMFLGWGPADLEVYGLMSKHMLQKAS